VPPNRRVNPSPQASLQPTDGQTVLFLAPSEAKAGYGIGDEGWLRGVLA
jgi:hypothetical protein